MNRWRKSRCWIAPATVCNAFHPASQRLSSPTSIPTPSGQCTGGRQGPRGDSGGHAPGCAWPC
eukprot:5297405-Alexandrium_andersonii.AAC.1